MQHRWMILLTTLVLFSLLLAPVNGANATQAGAQAEVQDISPTDCLPYKEGLLKDKAFLDSLPPECIQMYKEESREPARHAPAPDAAAGVVPTLSGGPDNFGYTYNDALAYGWINAATNSGLTGDDEFSGPLSIGFPFPFYGVPQTQLYFSTNGLVTFGAGSWEWGGYTVPNDRTPNNFIAPFWEDLLVGAPYNSGGIYYSKGGVAPNRYLVIEWRNVESFNGAGLVTFEVILHEKGDIAIQHKTLPSDYYSTVGIEDGSGYQGLEYQRGSDGLLPSKVIRFFHPTTPAGRVFAYTLQRGGFVPLNGAKNFSIIVRNQGTLGTDTYAISETNNWPWPVTYYASNGTTPLGDTDGDTLIDTGPIAQGASTTVIARYRVPGGSLVGASNFPMINFTSSRNASVEDSVALYMSVPAGFVNVFENDADGDGALSFLTTSVSGTTLSKATANNYWGTDMAVAQLTSGNYFYAWSKGLPSGLRGNIEYALLNRQGTLVRAAGKLTDNAAAPIYTWDDNPSIAVAPNGTVGVVWVRYLQNDGKYNYNIYFATFNAAGTRLTGPTNITNNTVWGNHNELNLPEFTSPNIAASSDNRFVIGWEEIRELGFLVWEQNVWYAVRNTAGASVLGPTALTFNANSWSPTFNSLTGGKVMVTWRGDGGPYYSIINSNGSIAKPESDLGMGLYWSVDAVQLPNGKVAVAWSTETGVRYVILNSSYNLESGPHEAASPSSTQGYALSVTTDASSRVIMTWLDRYNFNKQLYALADSTGAILTLPMYYNMSGGYIDVNWNGQGIAPYQADPVISGNAGMEGTTINYTGGSITADYEGDYSINVPPGWSGTVTPSKSGYIFSPTNRTYSNVTSDKTAQDYIARQLYTISGNVGVAGVKLSYTDGTLKTVTSQVDGKYALTVPIGWSGTVTPTHACFTFDPASQPYVSLGGHETAQDYTPSLVPDTGCADINVDIGAVNRGRFGLLPGASARSSFVGVDAGPVKIVSNNGSPIISAERVIYKVNNIATSFSEMIALPDSQLDMIYWLPWYNNKDLNTQLRIANVSATDATVHVIIGGVEVTGSPYTLAPGASRRLSFAGIDKGPVKIESDVNIVAAERVIYKVNGVDTSFSEMIALPNSQLDTIYWLPWYNNKDLNTQLRIANVSAMDATVHVSIGGVEMTDSPYTLAPGASRRLSFVGIDKGPVKIESNVDIVAAERVIYEVNGVATSFSETMAFPNGLLDTIYWLPWYNNKDLDSQLRLANVSATDATVHVTIGGVTMTGSPFTLASGASRRLSFPGIDKGPVKIESDVDIVAAERVIYKVNNIATSFSEMVALPDSLLNTIYWLPWYNNKELDTQLRFGVP